MARLLALLFFVSFLSSAQTSENTEVQRGSRLPVISMGPGLLYYRGDIRTDKTNEPVFSQGSWQLEVQLHTKSRFSFSAFFLTGKVSANEYSIDRPLNFKSSIFTEGVHVRYDFLNRNRPNATITPYVTAGIEFMFFNTKSDMKDAAGRDYHYWSDGTIRSEDEFSPDAPNAELLYRDYNYETDVRDANLDGFGKYKENTIAFPTGAGVRMRLSDRCSIHFGATLHWLRTDLLDGITDESKGTRRGDSENDKILNASALFRYDLAAGREVAKKKKGDYRNVDFKALEMEDYDGDGVPDLKDDSAASMTRQVDQAGRPIDTDGDGIADYLDQEVNSASKAIVNEHGVTITEKMIEEQFRKDSLAALPAIIEYVNSYDRLNKRVTGSSAGKGSEKQASTRDRKPIPATFKPVDKNKDGYISPPEIGTAIEDYMGGKSAFNSKEFYDLIDFYFRQSQ